MLAAVGCCWRILHTGKLVHVFADLSPGTLRVDCQGMELPYALGYRVWSRSQFFYTRKIHVNPCYCHCFLGFGVQNKANVLLKHPNPNKWFTFFKTANDTKRWVVFSSPSLTQPMIKLQTFASAYVGKKCQVWTFVLWSEVSGYRYPLAPDKFKDLKLLIHFSQRNNNTLKNPWVGKIRCIFFVPPLRCPESSSCTSSSSQRVVVGDFVNEKTPPKIASPYLGTS